MEKRTMEEVKSYIYSVILVSAAAGIITVMSPDGASDTIKRYVKYVVSLAVAVVLLIPLKDAVYELPKILTGITQKSLWDDKILDQNDELSGELSAALAGESAASIEASVKDLLLQKFGIAADAVSVRLDTSDYMNIKIVDIALILPQVYENQAQACSYLEQTFDCDVYIKG